VIAHPSFQELNPNLKLYMEGSTVTAIEKMVGIFLAEYSLDCELKGAV
jgi:hypothetical protein